jgi:hypothetical protein
MINRNDIEKLVNETIDSFDGLQKAEPKPFMFTRIMARMNRKDETILEKIVSLVSRPVVAFATVILFLAINAFVLFSISGSATPEEVQEPALVADSDYGLSVSSMYDINPEQNDLVQK